jgi:SAM-dependent methyltransferase
MSLPPEQPTIDEVRAFWNANPLWTGESSEEPGSPGFFASHTRACLDMIGGTVPARIWPDAAKDAPILDLGCGIGFWLEQFWERGHRDITGADLSSSSLALACKRCEHLGASVRLSEQNAEAMTFPDGMFQHVNCIGVIHHSPAPEQSIAEIARVLRPGGTAVIAVYNWNIALRAWPAIQRLARSASAAGATLQGRGRETMMDTGSARELVRLYDGADNPIGSAYSRQEFTAMLEKHFTVRDMFGYVFPSRILPFTLPGPLFRLAEKACPFMICGLVKKPANNGPDAAAETVRRIPATEGGSPHGS